MQNIVEDLIRLLLFCITVSMIYAKYQVFNKVDAEFH